jgi:hypothetical protein
MKKSPFILAIFTLFTFFGIVLGIETPEGTFNNIVDLEGIPTSVINHSVNAITGDYLMSRIDLTIGGAEPLFLERTYSCNQLSSSNRNIFSRHWNFNHGGKMVKDRKTKKAYIMINGCTKFKKQNNVGYAPDFKVFRKGWTNCSSEMSGQTHIKNERLETAHKNHYATIRTGSVTVHHFKKIIQISKSKEDKKNSKKLPIEFQLTDIQHPNNTLPKTP